MSVNIISFTRSGFSLSEKIFSLLKDNYSVSLAFGGKSVSKDAQTQLPEAVTLSEWTKKHFKKSNFLVFIGAAGIAVRAISPFVKDKKEDAAVLVIDEKGQFVIPILSGHIGGANEMARKIAEKLGAKAVITTASDVNCLPAIDEFAAKNELSINDMALAKDFAAKLLEKTETHPAFSISVYIKNDILNLIPRCLILGIGCKKGKSAEELEKFVRETLDSHKIDYRSLDKIASIDLKKDENAILSLAEAFSLPFVTFSAEELNKISQKVSGSDFVSKVTGTDNVCERSVFACGAEKLLVSKTSRDGMTLAIGIKKIDLEIPEELERWRK